LVEKHHTDTLKGALNSVGRNSVRLPTFQFEIVDCGGGSPKRRSTAC
jgi:hypothetical protein